MFVSVLRDPLLLPEAVWAAPVSCSTSTRSPAVAPVAPDGMRGDEAPGALAMAPCAPLGPGAGSDALNRRATAAQHMHVRTIAAVGALIIL